MTTIILTAVSILAVFVVILGRNLYWCMTSIESLDRSIATNRTQIATLSARLNDTDRAVNHRMQELETEFDAFNELRIDALFNDDEPFTPDTDMED